MTCKHCGHPEPDHVVAVMYKRQPTRVQVPASCKGADWWEPKCKCAGFEPKEADGAKA